jgi:hypothetical protein
MTDGWKGLSGTMDLTLRVLFRSKNEVGGKLGWSSDSAKA